MTITAADIDRIRAVAVADKAGMDGKDWDETVTPDVVIALCDHAHYSIKQREEAIEDCAPYRH